MSASDISTSSHLRTPKKSFRIFGSFLFAFVYVIFYYKYIPRIWTLQSILLPVILLIVIFTSLSIRHGALLLLLLIPTVNSLPIFFTLSGFNPLLFIFYAFLFGIMIHQCVHPSPLEWRNPLFIPMMGAWLVLVASAFLTLGKYTNFFPFYLSSIPEFRVNVLNVSAGESIRRVLFDSLNYQAGFIWFIIVVSVFKTKKSIHKIITFFAVASLISFIFGLYQSYINSALGNTDHFIRSNRINALFTDANALGVSLALSIPFLAVTLLIKKSFIKFLLILNIFGGILLIPNTGSRVGLLGLTSAFAFMLIFLTKIEMDSRTRNLKLVKVLRTHGATAVLLVAGIIIFAFATKGSSLGYKIDQDIKALFSHKAREVILHGRHLTWPSAVRMIKDYPFSGIGAGAFTSELPNYYKKHHIAPVKSSLYYSRVSPPDFHIDTAGNYYLQIVSEMGLIGLIFLGWMFYLILKRIFALHFKRKNTSEWGCVEAGLSSAILGMIIIFLFGVHTLSFEIQMTFWLFVGLLYTISPPDIDKGKLTNIPLIKTFAGVLITLYVILHAWNSSHSLSLQQRTEKFHLNQEFGFYQREIMDNRSFRWTGKVAGLTVRVKKPILVVPILASHPNTGRNPVEVRIYKTENLFRKKKLLEKVIVRRNTWRELRFDLSEELGSEFILLFDVSRTWQPLKAIGSQDPRNLGIGIGSIRFEDPLISRVKMPVNFDSKPLIFPPIDWKIEKRNKPFKHKAWCMDISLPEGNYLFKLRAKGQVANKEWPLLDIRINNDLIGEEWIESDEWIFCHFRTSLKGGKYRVCIGCINDGYVAQTREHRKLFVGDMEIVRINQR